MLEVVLPHLHRPVGRPAVRTAGPQISPPAGQEDRGRAFFNIVTGRATAELAAALEPAEPELFWGDDAHEQRGYCADVLLHETAVVLDSERAQHKRTKDPVEGDTGAVWRAPATPCCSHETMMSMGLCRGLPGHLDMPRRRRGDRLKS